MSETEMMGRGMVTPRQAAERYSIPRTSLFALMARGELPCIKLSARRVVIPVASLEAYLASKIRPAAK